MSVILSTFSNETRLKLLLCLSKGEKNVTELISNCELSQSAVSQHLEKLRSAGLVQTRKVGKEVYYSLIYPKAAQISNDLLSFVEDVRE
jgi:ArsR family transcriptional regulator